MNLEKNITELIHILKKEIQSLNTINELLMLEEKSLVDFNIKSLAEILDKQEDVFSSIACLEKSRMDVLIKISELTGVNLDELTVSRITEMVDNPIKKILMETGHVLSSINENLAMKKTSNAMLIKQGIILVENDIRAVLNAFGRTEPASPGYSSNAQRKGQSGSLRIDGRM